MYMGQHGAAANAEAADDAKEKQGIPIPRKRAANGRDTYAHGENAQGVATADALAWDAGQHSADDGADQRAGDGEAKRPLLSA